MPQIKQIYNSFQDQNPVYFLQELINKIYRWLEFAFINKF